MFAFMKASIVGARPTRSICEMAAWTRWYTRCGTRTPSVDALARVSHQVWRRVYDVGRDEQLRGSVRQKRSREVLRQPAPVEHALGVAALGLIEVITAMCYVIAALEAELATVFDHHTQATVISFPGVGRSMVATCSARSAMTRTVYRRCRRAQSPPLY
jgi:hypothetical protein